MFSGVESKQQVPRRKPPGEVEDLEIHITESPPERNREFKALDINGVTLSYDADEINILHKGADLTYVKAIGNLLVIYDKPEDLNGFWFVAEHIQRIAIQSKKKDLGQLCDQFSNM